MNKKINSIDEIGAKNVFQVPFGYFETISDEILSQLPERVSEEPLELSMWGKLKPWVYMAAMFAGIALMIRVFVGTPQSSVTASLASEGIQLTSASEIDEFYHYYEDQAANSAYREAMYLEKLPEEVK